MDIDQSKLVLLNGSLDEVKSALKAFEINSFDKHGSNILHYYVKNNEAIKLPAEDIIQLFIDFGININLNQSKNLKKAALHFAVLCNARNIFDILLKKGADVNIKDANGNTALSDAVFTYRGDDGYFIETLIASGADVDLINNYGVSPKSLAETIANYDTKKFFR